MILALLNRSSVGLFDSNDINLHHCTDTVERLSVAITHLLCA